MAGFDHDQVQRVLDWPLRELLLKHESILRDAALQSYRFSRLEWAIRTAMGGKQKAPKVPRILRES